MLKILRLVPNLDPKIFKNSLKIEKLLKNSSRCVSKTLLQEACQHIDIAIAYIDLGIVDATDTIFTLLKACRTKKELLTVLVPVLSRYRLSDDAVINECL